MKKVWAILFCLFGAAGVYLAWETIAFISSAPSAEHTEVIFEIPTGTPFYQVAHNLQDRGLVSDARKFSWMAKFLQETTRVRVGEYRLYTDMLPKEVLAVIVSGNSISYPLVVPEGFNIFDIRDELNKMWTGRGDKFLELVTDSKFIRELTGETLPSLEGYLFPDTYTLTKYSSIETLVRRMHERFLETIADVNKNAKHPLPLHEQVILASVIEKESGSPSDRQLISSVFHNRLAKGMKLQSDPTIIYGLIMETKTPVKNIKKTDILHPTPYNTYTVKSLPVGPISNPGREALWSAVNPADSNYFYFVSKNDGTTNFSENYKGHNEAVKNFQINPKARAGKSWRDLKKNQKPKKPTASNQ